MISKSFVINLLIAILIFNISSVSAQDNEWNLKKNKNGIIIHTREDKTTGNIEFKASIIIETTIDTLLSVFNDIENYKEWMADTKVSKTLKKINNTERYIYLEAQVPWPLENRDIPIYHKITRTSKSTKISLLGKPNYIAHKNGITRIEKAIGSWNFIPLANKKVKVTYQFMADPGLNIPNWIINLFIVDGPYKTLTNLKTIVEL